MSSDEEALAPKKGKSDKGFKEAAEDAAKDIHQQRDYKADLYVTTSGTGNPIHEYIVVLTPATIP